ncbi:citrate synthase [Thalassoglobus sp. JC818]|uniref:citrate synthase n=1 Tax=Thalassoglobus sp. JC818 TaxID=3232136 RepID=UPI0034587AA1
MAESLTITDNRTGKTYELPVENDTIRALDLRQIKVNDDDFGLMTYDPGYTNTASCKSSITYIDGDKGILEYRGFPIETLAENSSFTEVAYLLLNGKLPSADELSVWQDDINHHTVVHENIKRQMESFRYDAHPMGMMISTVAALSTFYPEAKNVTDPANRKLQIQRLIAKVPTIAAFTFRHSQGHPYIYPNNKLSYSENFLNMMFRMIGNDYEPNEALVKALDILFILHADHEQNCSTSVMRAIGSSAADPYSAWAGAAAALYGPLHGGANEAVLRMLTEIGHVKNVPDYVSRCKSGELRLMGFGHRVYKNYDPRARIIKKCADDVFEVTGRNPLLDVALELEKIALEDEYFVKRKLYPNVDFYSGLIYQAIGLPVSLFPVMFAIPRTVGWLAQWAEMMTDKDQRIQRPRQVYLGERNLDFVPISDR